MKKFTAKQGVISAISGLAAGAAAGVLPLLLMIFPGLFGCIGTAWGYGALGIASAAACGVIFANVPTLGMANCAGYAAMLLSQSFIITCIFRKKGAYRSAVTYCAFAAGLSQYAASCLMPLIELGDPFAYYIEYAAFFADAAVESAAQMGLEQAAMEQVEFFAAFLERSAPDIAVLSIVGTSLLAGLLNVLIAKGLCKKFKADIKPMAPFTKWQLSRSFYKGALILVVGAFIVSFSSINNASAILLALTMIVACPYMLMGLCFLVFSIKTRRRGKGFLILCTILLIALFPYSLYGLCIMGLADKLLGIRFGADRTKR